MTTRRDFLSAQPLREALERASEAESAAFEFPGNTVRLGKVAMASDFEVILNPQSRGQLAAASEALELIDRLEDQMSIYRPHSELSQLNARAASEPVPVESKLFDLLRETVQYAAETEGAFDPTAGPLVALWRQCRHEKRIPSDEELTSSRAQLGWEDVEFDDTHRTIRFRRQGISLNLNAIGKGYALDRAAAVLERKEEDGGRRMENGKEQDATPGHPPSSSLHPLPSFLLHGGYSSILARGSLSGEEGWPVSIRHPLFPNRTLGTLRLKDRGMSTSGSGVQFFRVQGRRYGHLLDPRTGWPAEQLLTAIVLAPTAAQAEALSTAFFVLGVEKAREYCHNRREVAALLVPPPRHGQRLEPVNIGIPPTDLWLDTNE